MKFFKNKKATNSEENLTSLDEIIQFLDENGIFHIRGKELNDLLSISPTNKRLDTASLGHFNDTLLNTMICCTPFYSKESAAHTRNE